MLLILDFYFFAYHYFEILRAFPSIFELRLLVVFGFLIFP